MIFTLLFALVGDLDFSIEYNITENTTDLFIFNGNNRSVHLFISNSVLNLICENGTNTVHKKMNISNGMMTYTWPDIVNGIHIDATFNETAAICNGPYQGYTFIDPVTVVEPEPCLTYLHKDKDNFSEYLIGPLIIQLLVIIYLTGKDHFPGWRRYLRSAGGGLVPRSINASSEKMDNYSLTSVSLTELYEDKV